MTDTKRYDFHLAVILMGKENNIPYFSYLLIGREFEKLGCKVTYIVAPEKVSDEDITRIQEDRSIDAILSHNFFLQRTSRRIFEKRLDCIFIDWLDTVYNKPDFYYTVTPFKMLVITADRQLMQYTEQVVRVKKPEFLKLIALSPYAFVDSPGAGQAIPDRKYDVLFFGRLGFEKDNFSEFNGLEKRFVNHFKKRAFLPGRRQMHEIVWSVFRWFRLLGLYKKSYVSRDFAYYCWKLSHTVRTQRRLFIMDEIFSVQGKRKLIISDQVERISRLDKLDKDCEVLSFQPWFGILDSLKNSKVVVNILPFHIHSVHERILTSMSLGCVVFSDRNPMLEELFVDGKEIIYFDYRKGELKSKLEYYLGRPELLQEIASNALFKVNKVGTAAVRAKVILEELEKIKAEK
ncbi:MAG TPA: glycosyltransferase [Bacteroidia bacterium]